MCRLKSAMYWKSLSPSVQTMLRTIVMNAWLTAPPRSYHPG